MRKPAVFKKIGAVAGGFLAIVAAAGASAAAVQAGRRPKASDLATLGIEPEAFSDIRITF